LLQPLQKEVGIFLNWWETQHHERKSFAYICLKSLEVMVKNAFCLISPVVFVPVISTDNAICTFAFQLALLHAYNSSWCCTEIV